MPEASLGAWQRALFKDEGLSAGFSKGWSTAHVILFHLLSIPAVTAFEKFNKKKKKNDGHVH